MDRIESKITAQGQISVPATIRRLLGLTPGSKLEWLERNGEIVVRRASRYSSEEIHRALFEEAPRGRLGTEEVDEAIRERMRVKHARD